MEAERLVLPFSRCATSCSIAYYYDSLSTSDQLLRHFVLRLPFGYNLIYNSLGFIFWPFRSWRCCIYWTRSDSQSCSCLLNSLWHTLSSHEQDFTLIELLR